MLRAGVVLGGKRENGRLDDCRDDRHDLLGLFSDDGNAIWGGVGDLPN